MALKMDRLSKYLNKNKKNFSLTFFIIDIVLFALCFLFAFYIDSLNAFNDVMLFYGQHKASLGMTMLLCLPCLITTIAIMFFSNVYRIAWRYAGTMEMLRLMLIAFVSIIFALIYRGLFTFIFREGDVSPNADNVNLMVVLFAYFMFFLLATMYRILSKLLAGVHSGLKIKDKYTLSSDKVIVYGAGYNGAALVKRMIENPKDGYIPVALIDDNPDKKGMLISGVEVVGGREMLTEIMNKYNAKSIVIAISSLNKRQLREIFDYVKQFGLRIMITSAISDASSTLNGDVVSIRNIKIEDLLHRDEHDMDKALVDGFIKDKVIMVTGGAGSIGSELCRQALIYGCKHLVIFDQHENGMFEINEELKKLYEADRYSLEVGTVRDRNKLREVMERYKPNVVFHAAAYKHVPMMEISADESIKNNVFGTKNVIEQCDESGVEKFVLISTDKAINPANIMGATKRVAELVLQSMAKKTKTQLAAVRFGNVLGSSGSVIPTFIRQINAGGPVTVTDKDMKRYFMTIPEAVRLVLQAGSLANGGEVFVLDMGEPVYIYDLACDLVIMSGLVPEKDIDIKISGLRPGEKLFEELQYGNESVDSTKHKDIFVCKLVNVDTDKIFNTIDKMYQAASIGDKMESERLLFELVPSEYRNLHKNPNARV
jgi:FlaA1/EpsC-like NDP-sugar epimerase